MYVDIHVKYQLLLSDLKDWLIFRIFQETSNTKFHENPSSSSHVFPCGRTDGHDEANSRRPLKSRSHVVHSNGVIFTRIFAKIRPVAQTCSGRHTLTDRIFTS